MNPHLTYTPLSWLNHHSPYFGWWISLISQAFEFSSPSGLLNPPTPNCYWMPLISISFLPPPSPLFPLSPWIIPIFSLPLFPLPISPPCTPAASLHTILNYLAEINSVSDSAGHCVQFSLSSPFILYKIFVFEIVFSSSTHEQELRFYFIVYFRSGTASDYAKHGMVYVQHNWW